MKQLYHGSIYDFSSIDLSKGRDFKDFGKGFYATAFPDHADRLARRNKRIAQKRQIIQKGQGKLQKLDPIVAYRYSLLFDDQAALELDVLKFSSADRQWLKFVMQNRYMRGLSHSYDIVIGPTADAETSTILNAYQDDLLESDFDELVCEKVISELKPENLPKQYFFGTEKAIATLHFANTRRVVVG